MQSERLQALSYWWLASFEISNWNIMEKVQYCGRRAKKFEVQWQVSSQLLWGAVSPAGGGVLCFKSKSTWPSSRTFCWKCWLPFIAGLGTHPQCQMYQNLFKWPWDYCACLGSKLTWPEPHWESMGQCQEKHETEKSWRPLLTHPGLNNHPAGSQALSIHTTPHWGGG